MFSDMKTTLRAANEFDPDHRFFLMLGDLVNQIGSSPGQIVNYTNAASEFNITRPIAATQGNHDAYHNNGTLIYGEATVFNAFVTFPGNGWDQGVYEGPNRSKSYYFYYNNVLVIMLNSFATTNDISRGSAPDHTAQADWLRNILERDKTEGKSKYRIVGTHVNAFGGYIYERDFQPEIRAAFGRIFTDYDVDIVFSGHDHIYGRSNPIKITGNNTATTEISSIDFGDTSPGGIGIPGGTIYSTVGSTGPKFYALSTAMGNAATYIPQYFPIRYSGTTDLTPGMFVNVKVTGEKLIVTARRIGVTTTLDTYEIMVKR